MSLSSYEVPPHPAVSHAEDRNRDALVTRGELVIEISSHTEMHRLRDQTLRRMHGDGESESR